MDEKTLDRELEVLLRAQCIINEDLRADVLADEVLIRLGPAGFVHLDMLSNIDYLAAIAEDTWFADEDLARRVADRIKMLETQYQPGTALANARDLLQYLLHYRDAAKTASDSFMEPNPFNGVADMTAAVSSCTYSVAGVEFAQADDAAVVLRDSDDAAFGVLDGDRLAAGPEVEAV